METKTCTKCKKELTLDNFRKCKLGKNGLDSACKECENERIKEYRKTHQIETKEYNKRYRIDNLEKKKEINKNYRKNNVEKVKETNRNYRKNNLERGRITENNRRARKKLLAHTLTITQWENVKNKFNNRCCYCGRKLPLAQEHFLALSNLGEYTLNNIVPSCQSCNSSKGNKDYFVWYKDYEYYNRQRETYLLKYLHYNKQNNQQLAFII